MEFASDARPLVDPCFQPCVELPRQLTQSQFIEHPKQCHKRRYTRQTEPRGLVVRRGYGKIQERSGLIPHTAVVASRNAEAVVAWWQIAIERLPAIADILPIAIPAFQLVTKLDLLRHDEAESGVVDLQIACQRGQAQVRRRVAPRVLPGNVAVRADLFDVKRRRQLVV